MLRPGLRSSARASTRGIGLRKLDSVREISVKDNGGGDDDELTGVAPGGE
jgi:hypothetical protein